MQLSEVENKLLIRYQALVSWLFNSLKKGEFLIDEISNIFFCPGY